MKGRIESPGMRRVDLRIIIIPLMGRRNRSSAVICSSSCCSSSSLFFGEGRIGERGRSTMMMMRTALLIAQIEIILNRVLGLIQGQFHHLRRTAFRR